MLEPRELGDAGRAYIRLRLAALPDETLRPFLARHASLDAHHLQAVVNYCRVLFFLAYDGEGYVLWSPGGAGSAAPHSAGRL